MKPWPDMTEQEKRDFLVLSGNIITAVRDETEVEQEFRPAIILLYVAQAERPVGNLWTHYDVDPNGFIDESIRQGVRFIDNLQRAIDAHPPPPEVMKPHALKEQRERLNVVIDMLRMPSYRPILTEVVNEFFRDQREQGYL